MKLLYLYIPDFSILKDVELNFTADKRFSYNKETRKIKEYESSGNLPDNFFSSGNSSKESVPIEAISVIIGNNGAGKTSVANFIHYILSSSAHEFILIWQSFDGSLKCSSFIIPEILTEDEINKYDAKLEKLPEFKQANFGSPNVTLNNIYNISNKKYTLNRKFKYFDALKSSLNHESIKMCHVTVPKGINHTKWSEFQFVYFTSNYTPMHQIESINKTIDISTTYLIKHDTETFTNTGANEKIPINVLNHHMAMEFLRQAKFISDFHNNNFEPKWDFPVPKGCVIKIESFEIDQIKKLNANDKDSEILRLTEKVKDVVLRLNINLNLSARVFSAFIANQMRYFLSRTDKDYIKSVFPIVYKKLDKFYILLRTNEFSVQLCENFISEMCFHVYEMNGLQINEPHDEWKYILKILQIFDKQHETSPLDGQIMFNCDEKNQFDTFINLMHLYFKSNLITNYLLISWNPHFSSGEATQLNIYSRLYSIMNKLKDGSKDILLFMDEIEITIHPIEQAKLIFNLVIFLERYFSEYKFHIIFASHSPILLSDIPRSNTVLLHRKRVKNAIDNVVVESLNAYPETFGANIHSLYKKSFLMENGLVGAFAKEKITGLVNRINRLKKEGNSSIELKFIEEEINTIGEPFIQKKIFELYLEKLSDKTKVRKLQLIKKLKYYQNEAKRISDEIGKGE